MFYRVGLSWFFVGIKDKLLLLSRKISQMINLYSANSFDRQSQEKPKSDEKTHSAVFWAEMDFFKNSKNWFLKVFFYTTCLSVQVFHDRKEEINSFGINCRSISTYF